LTIYLGGNSYLDENGRLWMASIKVVDFVLSALRLEKLFEHENPAASQLERKSRKG
jgi:hypothetical protein